MTMEKVTIKELFRDIFKRSTLIAIPNIGELLEVRSSMYTKWEIFVSIVRDALKTFEYHYPLVINQQVFIDVDPKTRSASMKGNFDAYIKGIIDESQLLLTPEAVVGFSYSNYPSKSLLIRGFRYDAPMVYDVPINKGKVYALSICKRPLYEEYDEVTKEPTDNCAVYFMGKDMDSKYSIFRDELYLCLCRYIINIKKNLMLTNMPIELFQGLEDDYSRMEGKQEQIYQQASVHSMWIN